MKHDLLVFGLGLAAAWVIRWARALWPSRAPFVRRHWTKEER
jgi:hypothetical protein